MVASSARPPRGCPPWSTTCWTWPRSRPARPLFGPRRSRSPTSSKPARDDRPLLSGRVGALVFEEPVGVAPLQPTKGSSRRSCGTSSRTRRSSPNAGEIRVAAAPGRATRSSSRCQRHRDRHRPGGPRPDLRGVRPGRRAAPGTGEGDRAGAAAVAQAGRIAGRQGFRQERAGGRLDLLAVIPRVYRDERAGRPSRGPRRAGSSTRGGCHGAGRRAATRSTCSFTRKSSRASGFQVLPARTLDEARRLMRSAPADGRAPRHPARGRERLDACSPR